MVHKILTNVSNVKRPCLISSMVFNLKWTYSQKSQPFTEMRLIKHSIFSACLACAWKYGWQKASGASEGEECAGGKRERVLLYRARR